MCIALQGLPILGIALEALGTGHVYELEMQTRNLGSLLGLFLVP